MELLLLKERCAVRVKEGSVIEPDSYRYPQQGTLCVCVQNRCNEKQIVRGM